jgi:selenocysteine-specific elongation factor
VIVVGTAGHIDHGKTSLVRALTGVDTDRLPVEKQRGITTDLGFARLELGGRTAAMIDVPGHERFVKSMVAGATGIDVVCLVIAADEGVMPQTREHLEICELLGVRGGVVALTKRDLVDDEWLALVTAEVGALLAGTFLDGAPLLACSTRTGDGLAELRAELAARIAGMEPRPATGVFRLPIDRVFTLAGFGTIVTGTVIGGTVAKGDELVVVPGLAATRVRGLQVHDAEAERAVAGQRAALNLAHLAVDDLTRGDVLAHPGAVVASHLLDVSYRHLASAPALPRARQRVLLHHGTAQRSATLVLVDPTRLEPCASGIAQLRLDASMPLAAAPGDRFLVRISTPTGLRTVGGGTVVRVAAPRSRDAAGHARTVANLAAARYDRRIPLEVAAAAAAGLEVTELARRLGTTAAVLEPVLRSAVAESEIFVTGDGERAHLLHARVVAALEAEIATRAAGGISRETLRGHLAAALPAPAFTAILHALETRGVVELDGEQVRRTGAVRAPLTAAELAVLAVFERTRFEPPTPAPAEQPIIDRLVAARRLVRIKPALYVHADALAELRARLIAFLTAHETIDAQAWKDLTAASRKFTIPLAEHFDAERVTLRVGNVRRLRRNTTS